MTEFWKNIAANLPEPVRNAIDVVLPFSQILLIIVLAVALRYLVRKLIAQMVNHYSLPMEFHVGARRICGFIIFAGAILMVMERLGVSGEVLWSALTGFTAVAAVAFFAAWSVLSNIFCSVLVFTTRLFRLGDHIEVLENGEKPGLKGRVLDINLIYTTLEESGDARQGTQIKVPNSLFFQRSVRRWIGEVEACQVVAKPYQTPPAPAAAAGAAPPTPGGGPLAEQSPVV